MASWLLVTLIVLGLWQSGFSLPDFVRVQKYEYETMQVRVYAPIENENRCLRATGEPIIRDLHPSTA